jgi:oxaloacetate decarboxylase alpha subunit
MNVLAGERYKIIPNEVKNYVRGQYGRSPVPVTRKMIRTILGDEKPITGRPADSIAPMLPNATDGIDPKLIEREEDILSFLLLPEPAVEYFKWRALPADQRPETPADLELKKLKIEPKASAPVAPAAQVHHVSKLTAALETLVGSSSGFIQEVLQKIDGLSLEEVVFRKGDQRIAVRGSGGVSTAGSHLPALPTASVPAAPVSAPAPAPAAAPAEAAAEYKRTINAPLVGRFYSSAGPGKSSFVAVGDVVEAGTKVCIVEAMKLFNEITVPVKCRIVKMLVDEGASVQKGQPIVAIEEV